MTSTSAETNSEQAQCAMMTYSETRLLALERAVRMGLLTNYLRIRRGERIPIAFPTMQATRMVLYGPGEVGPAKCDVSALMALNPSVGPLVIIGYLEGWCDAQGDDKCIFLVSPLTAMYLYDPGPYGGLYRLSENMCGFIKRGLLRYDGIYKEVYMKSIFHPRDGVSPLPITERGAINAGGLECLLEWPSNYTFVFGIPDERADDTALLNEEQSGFCVQGHLFVFGHFGPRDCATTERTSTFLGTDGAVYAFHRGALRLLRLAESLQMFYAIGIRRFFKSYRVIPSRAGDDLLFLNPE
uniref:Protein m25.2 n=1 Tax=Mastomys natalensis cytomegalovirus 1 TaxID=2973541 RepID=A0A9Y1IKZ6_9BETA|nr:protein m25.2 [Mastomys natalensis cytomegalovirus 1]